jgi:hypothetical protein
MVDPSSSKCSASAFPVALKEHGAGTGSLYTHARVTPIFVQANEPPRRKAAGYQVVIPESPTGLSGI